MNGMCGIEWRRNVRRGVGHADWAAPSGLDLLFDRIPRALPWAGVVRPVGADESRTLAKQTRIVAEVEWLLSVVEELEAVVSANLQRAARLHQSILHKAFSGNLAVGARRDA